MIDFLIAFLVDFFYDFWDDFWEPDRIKKLMEFMTPFSVNFFVFWTIFFWILGSGKLRQKCIFLSLVNLGRTEPIQDSSSPYRANLGLPF